MPPRPRTLPAQLADGFSTKAAQNAGVTDRRLRSSDLLAPFYGVRLKKAAVATIVESARDQLARDVSPLAVAAASNRSLMMLRAAAFAELAPPHFFFSHICAAVAYGVPLPLRVIMKDLRPTPVAQALRVLDADRLLRSAIELDVATLAPHRAPRSTGIHGRQLSPAQTAVCRHNGLRVADPASMWAQLGTVLTVDELIAIGDALVHEPREKGGSRGPALATLAQLESAVVVDRRRSKARLGDALEQIRVGSMSLAETDLRLAIVRAGLPEPTLDFDVMDAEGRAIGFTELAYPAFRLLIEYEGDHHRTDRAQWNRDIEKRAQCAAAGWSVVQITAQHLYPRSDAATRLIREALLRAGWQPAG